ncbi:MAG TPA: Rnase Y domain-containing protein, partial [Candidatus Dormibacteraeota bacterium]|nr:Rnase Y domain-containing protein [Candidatus Dormibacteraeota bacterium]
MVFAVAAFVYARRVAGDARTGQATADTELHERAQAADHEAQQALVTAREEAFRIRGEAEAEVRERRAEVARLEQRNSQREEAHERRLRELEQSEQRLTRREEELEEVRQTTESERALVGRELERVAGLSQAEARAELIAGVEAELDAEVAERIRDADRRVREEAGERSREILIAAMQRHASDQTGESSVTVMHLPSDDLKGRIIGREGRNIRALEAATGVDVIVDETPESVVLSGFDPVRREVARVTLERLFADGRIHPARIEEMVGKSRGEIIQR